ncbi:hypothetical protein TruAng_012294 [Truncatella angustata]|nr:hypothetical protein TruAng_012294 [Truncatella angustata]
MAVTESVSTKPKAYNLDQSNLIYFFHHIFLPPKLPGGDDRSVKQDDGLLSFVQACLAAFSVVVAEEYRNVVHELLIIVEQMRQVRNCFGYLDEQRLYEVLQQPPVNGLPSVLPLTAPEK